MTPPSGYLTFNQFFARHVKPGRRPVHAACDDRVLVSPAETVDGNVVNTIEAVEGTGYQFLQTRGLVVLETAHGLVACLPVGMAQVSSVVITAEVGVALRKGEEMGYFQFGGSDLVMVFESRCGVVFDVVPDQHTPQGRRIGRIG